MHICPGIWMTFKSEALLLKLMDHAFSDYLNIRKLKIILSILKKISSCYGCKGCQVVTVSTMQRNACPAVEIFEVSVL